MKADNKGCNEMIHNITQNFIGCPCKYCLNHYNTLPSLLLGQQRLLTNNHTLFGIDLVTKSFYSPDIFHDICEKGVIEKFFSN